MSNRFYDPLYSREGGPPRAYECLMESTEPEHRPGKICGHVYKTARGIEGHLSTAHGLGLQVTLDELIKREEDKTDGSKRVSTQQDS